MKPSSPAGSPPTPDLMPTLDDVVRFFNGAFLLMAGKADGLKRLDLSADGFWQSFAAVIVALPPLALSWLAYELGGSQLRAAASFPKDLAAALAHLRRIDCQSSSQHVSMYATYHDTCLCLPTRAMTALQDTIVHTTSCSDLLRSTVRPTRTY